MDLRSSDGRIPVVVEFTGGLELLFSNQRKHQVAIPNTDGNGRSANLAFLVRYLCENLMTDKRKEMFVMDGTVSVVPGARAFD